jgi:hypothetical protein
MRTGWHHTHVLEPSHIVHLPVATAPYRQSIAISAQATCPVTRSCEATLYYRTTQRTVADPIDDFVPSPMGVVRTGTTVQDNDVIQLTGSIPAGVVDTRGVDYFFSVTDAATLSWWPGTSPVDGYVPVAGARVGYQHIRVLEPPHVTHAPPTATPALKPFTVDAQISCATEACTATLWWADGLGVSEAQGLRFEAIPMIATGSPVTTTAGSQRSWRATIPGDRVTTRGLAYFIEAGDGFTKSFAPGTFYWGAYVPMDGQHLGDVETAELVPHGSNFGTGGPDDNTTLLTAGGNSSLQAGAVFPVRVLEPPHPAHVPVGRVNRNQPVAIQATSNCSSATCAATLNWSTPTSGWQQRPMTATQTAPASGAVGSVWQYRSWIPAADVVDGLNYRIEVTDGYSAGSTPTWPVVVGTQTLAAAGDRVWLDRDGNGSFGPGDVGIPGARVKVTWAGVDGVLGTPDDLARPMVTTSEDGEYVAGGLVAGRYRVTVDGASLPAGVTQVSGPATAIVNVSGNEFRRDIDFGYS